MAYIGRQLVRGQNRVLDDISGSFNGSTTAFNLTVSSESSPPASVNQLWIILGGILQKPGTDFTVADAVLTFTTAPASTLSFWGLIQGDTSDINSPADASVTPSKIANSGDFAFPADVRFKDADGSHYVGLQAPSTVSSNLVWSLPAADGSANQLLKTDGSGNLGWASDANAPEGTAVLSTGETGTTKYLRVDGDNTCSWQLAVDATKMPLAGGTFTGDVTFTGDSSNGLWDKSASAFVANLTGNVTGNASGSAATVTGAAQSAITSLGTLTGLTVDGDVTLTGASANVTWDKSTDDLIFNDNAKAIFGTSSDGVEIYHDGSNSIINDAGTGSLRIAHDGNNHWEFGDAVLKGNDGRTIILGDGSDLRIYHSTVNRFDSYGKTNDFINKDTDGSVAEYMVRMIPNGATELYHDGTKCLETRGDGGIEATDGNFIVGTSGHGIQFDTADSGSDQILDDYEEGSWTPTMTANVSSSSGGYTKIGRIVHAYFQLHVSSNSTSSNMVIDGLPFASNASLLSGNIVVTNYGAEFKIFTDQSANIYVRTLLNGNIPMSDFSGKWFYGELHYQT